MAIGATATEAAEALEELEATAVLGALPFPVLVVGPDDTVLNINSAAEQFLGHGAAFLRGAQLTSMLPFDSPLLLLIDQVRRTGSSMSEYDVTVELPPRRSRRLTVQAAPLGEQHRSVALSFQEQSIARNIDRQLVHRNAARSVTALASVLAHEVKNPLSGIRGAAQLLEQTADDGDRRLTRLICDETDRICALLDRMAIFSEQPTLEHAVANIHEVLERVRQIAQAGFARHVRFVETYDPSLPLVRGDRAQLIQVFLNLVKNAAEAVPAEGGEIILATAYRHGIRLAPPGGDRRVHLPLRISVIDNGPGIPPDVATGIFDPFVTTKSQGGGLGLALVAKLIGDHGGAVEFDSEPGRTEFDVMLPMAEPEGSP